MAVYVKTFENDTVGQAPSGMTVHVGPTGWTVETVTDAEGGKALKVQTSGANANRGIGLDVVDSDPDRADFEVLFRAKRTVLGQQVELGAVGRGNSDPDWVRGILRDSNELNIDELNNAAFDSKGIVSVDPIPATEWFYIRFRATGPNLQVKAWAASEAEPGAFPQSWTESSISAPGFVGLGLYRVDDQQMYVDYLSIATAGDSAVMPDSLELTNASAQADGTTSFTGSVDCLSSTGTLYFVATTTSIKPTVSQIKSGLDDTGTAAPFSSSQSITASGAQTVSGSGLTASTTYYLHFVSNDGVEDSNVVSSPSFTTAMEPPQSITVPTGLNTTNITHNSATLNWIRG